MPTQVAEISAFRSKTVEVGLAGGLTARTRRAFPLTDAPALSHCQVRCRCRRDCPDGRFTGPRWNVEGIPRLPTFPARWVLEDPRRRPYLVFWGPEHGPAFALKMMPSAEGDAVLIKFKNGKMQQISILRRPLPRGTGTAIFYICPSCQKPRRQTLAVDYSVFSSEKSARRKHAARKAGRALGASG